MRSKLFTFAIAGSCLSIGIGLLSGCAKNQSDNAQAAAQLASDEVSNMGAEDGAGLGNLSTGKVAVGAVVVDTVTVDLSKYHWDSAGSFVRSITIITSLGYERNRVDTVTFLDAAGDSLAAPHHGQRRYRTSCQACRPVEGHYCGRSLHQH